jgi:hypothetical protein
MQETYSWPWIETQVAQTIEVWNACAAQPANYTAHYSTDEQKTREKVYDKALREVEREAKRKSRTRTERLDVQERITASFGRFSAAALDLPDGATQLLTDDFLPVGTRLARWARRFDESLSMTDIVQACRNAWTACGLQPLLGARLELTPSILGYSLLYPYTDNFLDRPEIAPGAKRRFSERFRERLRGQRISAKSSHEIALWALVELVEGQYSRDRHPQVFDCLLAIHRAQEDSLAQLDARPHASADILRVSCAKGGSSVLADACLANGCLTEQEGRFAFEWGVLLQLGDDLQDVREDLQRSSATLFTRAVAHGIPLDSLATQLFRFSEIVGARMDDLPNGSAMLKDLLRMSWRSLIVGAVGDSREFFSPEFIGQTELTSPFRFAFLRARRKRMTSRQGLFATLFDAFLEAPEDEVDEIPLPAIELAAV